MKTEVKLSNERLPHNQFFLQRFQELQSRSQEMSKSATIRVVDAMDRLLFGILDKFEQQFPFLLADFAVHRSSKPTSGAVD
jgi:hypothetical protein